MAGRAPRVVPYVTSPALAHILTAHRAAGRPAEATRGHMLPHYLLFGAALIAFLISAGAIVAPQVTPFFQRPVAQQAPAGATSPLSRADIETVLSYVQQMRADDTLIQVQPSVFAKRSNVQGVQAGGRTVFYDLAPHQSFGPLRAGRVSESGVDVVARERVGDTLVLVYTMK